MKKKVAFIDIVTLGFFSAQYEREVVIKTAFVKNFDRFPYILAWRDKDASEWNWVFKELDFGTGVLFAICFEDALFWADRTMINPSRTYGFPHSPNNLINTIMKLPNHRQLFMEEEFEVPEDVNLCELGNVFEYMKEFDPNNKMEYFGGEALKV